MLVRISSGKQYEATSDATLLDAAHGAGITLPYSCKTGRCSTCKGRVLVAPTEPQASAPRHLQTASGRAACRQAAYWSRLPPS